jgi:hypothetical protein
LRCNSVGQWTVTLEEGEPLEKEGVVPSEGDENYEKMMKLFKSEKP